jgi:S1-C subfamily serine protease
MDHRKGKMEEEKFNFTPDNETAGYISQPQSARLDIRSASETPADYGRRITRMPLGFDLKRVCALLGLLIALLVACDIASDSVPSQRTAAETPMPEPTPASISEAIEKVRPAVVYIVAEYGRWRSAGTGMIIHADGYVLTNNHVVERGYHATVYLPDGRGVSAQIAYRDPYQYIALLKLPDNLYPRVTLGTSQQLALGEEVIALGYPLANVLGNSVSASKGIISAFRSVDSTGYIQTDATLHPGNSGGPLINIRGEVVGINTLRLEQEEGISLAIEIKGVKGFVEDVVHNLVTQGNTSLSIPVDPPIPVQSVVLKQSGTGKGSVGRFSVRSSPWKVFFRPEFDGRPQITADYHTGRPISQRAIHMDVTAGRVYQTYVYTEIGVEVQLNIDAPPGGDWTVWVVDELISVAPVPFEYSGQGEVRTPPFWLERSKDYKLTFYTSWDGGLTIGWHTADNELIFYRSTGQGLRFPDEVKTGLPSEFIFNWRNVGVCAGCPIDRKLRPVEAAYLQVEGAPPISEWTILVSEVLVTPTPTVTPIAPQRKVYDFTGICEPSHPQINHLKFNVGGFTITSPTYKEAVTTSWTGWLGIDINGPGGGWSRKLDVVAGETREQLVEVSPYPELVGKYGATVTGCSEAGTWKIIITDWPDF